MLRNAFRRPNLSPSADAAAAVRTTPFICYFCTGQPPLPRHLSIMQRLYKSRSSKHVVIPAPDLASDTVLTELRKDIKESVARKNEETESKRWKRKINNDTEPATSEAAVEARKERQRRQKEKAKSRKVKKKRGEAVAAAAVVVPGENVRRERVGKKREGGASQNVSVRRVAQSGTTPKEMGGVSLAAALKNRPKDKNMLLMDPGIDGVKPINMNDPKRPPSIKHDLDRVLFNPGVHYLQDPRSRVYNFDPYLRDIMPVTEFDFAAVDSYITSSRDTKLSALAASLGKKYVGSTSSMTSVLAHFHYLLSHWRNINTGSLSKDFPAEYNTFTQLSRAPAAVFLRYKGNGTYAIDPDKEFDMDSILSLLGRSLEKMLTMAPADYAALRLDAAAPPAPATGPDTFHYSTLGDFLMRSQLDAHDSRLPGTGMFDLKTRAVVSVRMDVANFHLGSGYQIKTLKGQWESFEREYFDMIRAAFLKYSLQVRMGRMDGIFVAFHNTERIFGFQYVSLDEMDASIHEAWGSGVGEREFVLSLMFLNEALNRATAKFPEQSLRLHFETRETQTPQMYITAEPMAEADIEAIQNRNARNLNEFLKSLEVKRDSVLRKAESKGAAVKFDGDVAAAAAAAAAMAVQVDEKEAGETEDPEKAADVDSPDVDISKGEVDVPAWESGAESVETAGVGVFDKELDSPAWESGQRGAEGVESAGSAVMIDETGANDRDAEQIVQDDVDEDDDDNDDDNAEDEDDSDSDSDSDSDDDEAEAETKAEAEEDVEIEEIPDEHMEKIIPDGEPDVETPPPPPATTEFDRPLLAMTLTTFNRVNGKPVLRPSLLRPSDTWTVNYTITEAKTNERAWSTYNSIKTRRKKAVESTDLPENSEEVSQYVKYLRTLSKSGRAWAAEQEATFGLEKVVYKGKEGEKGEE